MVTKTITEQRAEVRIFAGNDPAHTATGSSGISQATPANARSLWNPRIVSRRIYFCLRIRA